MADDDIVSVVHLAAAPGEDGSIAPGRVGAVIQNAYRMAKDLGVSIFTFNMYGSPVAYSGHSPFSVVGPMSAHASGLIKDDKVKFRPDIVTIDDGWISFINAFHNRMTLIDNRYHFTHTGTWATSGGLSNTRNTTVMRREMDELIIAFGDAVVEQHGPDGQIRLGTWRMNLPF
jgi:hypothetical protein